MKSFSGAHWHSIHVHSVFRQVPAWNMRYWGFCEGVGKLAFLVCIAIPHQPEYFLHLANGGMHPSWGCKSIYTHTILDMQYQFYKYAKLKSSPMIVQDIFFLGTLAKLHIVLVK